MGSHVSSELEHLREAAAIARVEVPVLVAPEHGDVVANSMRLHYLDWGTKGRPAIVFLHGGALTARTWDLVCLALRSDFHCVALDQRGHGDSEWSPGLDYSLETHVADVQAFVDTLDLGSVVLVGHSLGAFVGIALAAQQAQLVRALVLVDAGPGVSAAMTERVSEFILGPDEMASVDDFVTRARSFNPRRNERLLRRSLLHNLRTLPDGGWTWKYDRRHLSPEAIDRMRQRFNELGDDLRSIACPTLVVRGAESEFSDDDADRVARQIPDATWLRIEDAGHTVQGDNPRDLAAALTAFLRKRASGGA